MLLPFQHYYEQNFAEHHSDNVREAVAVRRADEERHRDRTTSGQSLYDPDALDSDADSDDHARHHQEIIDNMAQEVADRSQMKRLSEMLVSRKARTSHHAGGISTPAAKRKAKAKSKSSKPSVSFADRDGRKSVPKNSPKRKSVAKGKGKRNSAFLTQQGSPDFNRDKVGKMNGQTATARIQKKALRAAKNRIN